MVPMFARGGCKEATKAQRRTSKKHRKRKSGALWITWACQPVANAFPQALIGPGDFAKSVHCSKQPQDAEELAGRAAARGAETLRMDTVDKRRSMHHASRI